MKQTQMYICTHVEFILVERSGYIAAHVETEILYGIYTGIYTIATIDKKCEKCS